MIVSRFTATKIETEFADVDTYKLVKDVNVNVYTDEGVLRYTMVSGFPTNMRSGSHAIDILVPKFTGNNLYNAALLCHDAAYTTPSNILSRELADELLYQMAILSCELGKVRAAIMWRSLRMFGNGAYEEPEKGLYIGARDKITFNWSAY